jgi:hypothetical protein
LKNVHEKEALDKSMPQSDYLSDLRSANAFISPGTGGSLFRLSVSIVQRFRRAGELRVRTMARLQAILNLCSN